MKILPAGALLWAWDADKDRGEAAGEQWLILLPEKWNMQVQYAWRFDLDEHVPQGLPQRAARPTAFEDEEYLTSDAE